MVSIYFKKEYPNLGYEAEEVHNHTQMLYDLVNEGKLISKGYVVRCITGGRNNVDRIEETIDSRVNFSRTE